LSAEPASGDGLSCRFRLTHYLRFTALLLAFGLAAAAGMTRAGLTPLLVGWVGFIIVAFFFPGWGIRVLCTHCPFYARPGLILRCNSTIGPLKLWRRRPGPASGAERVQLQVILAVLFGFPVIALLVAGQFLWAGLTAAAAALLAWTETTFACRRCVNFACFLNRVSAGRRDAFLDRHPDLKKDWAQRSDA